MAVLGTRIESLDMLPSEVLVPLQELHLALRMHTEYDGVQITFENLRTEMNVPTIDVQMTSEER